MANALTAAEKSKLLAWLQGVYVARNELYPVPAPGAIVMPGGLITLRPGVQVYAAWNRGRYSAPTQGFEGEVIVAGAGPGVGWVAKNPASAARTIQRILARPVGHVFDTCPPCPVQPAQDVDPADFPENRTYRYTQKYRPPMVGTVPAGFRLVEAPQIGQWAKHLPASQHRYGVIEYSRPLTDTEIRDYELEPV